MHSRAWLLLLMGCVWVEAKRSRHHRDNRDVTTTQPTFEPFYHTSTLDPADEEEEELTQQNPCLVRYCGAGRECVVTAGGSASCVCQQRCPPHGRAVCGTDGIVYPNHCQLHRAACLRVQPIAVDHSFSCKNTTNHTTDADVRQPDVQKPIYPDDMAKNYIDDRPNDKTDCSLQDYDSMKDNLLLFNHARLLADEIKGPGKELLVSVMFSHFDQNNDGILETDELQKIAAKEHDYDGNCALTDLLVYDDSDGDGRLNINEFYTAFSVSVISLDKSLEVNHVTARVGDNVEIKCDVTGTPPPPITWQRNSADLAMLNEEEIHVFSDGSLYLTHIQLIHAGNYTCHAQRNSDVMQTHVLTVHTVPEVRVTPRIQSKRPGEDASMFCHVVGEPFPKVEWLKNEEPLKLGQFAKYEVIGNGTELQIRNIGYADTGAYMCQASNIGGVTRDISSLIVQEEPTPAPNEERRFFSFHDWGVSVYEPTACRLYHEMVGTDIIPGTQEYVCGSQGVNCSWGQAINVANRYVYVTQPKKDRVLVISKTQMVVVDVVVTDKYPVSLYYVPHLDQVWVLNWRSERDAGVKTIQVIRDASQKRKHHTVHPEPIDGQFDLVRGLFMPPVQDMSHKFKYGYVTHGEQRGLFKLDLANMRYIRSVDLSSYSCVPRDVQFSALYGFVMIECEEPVSQRPTGQILLDLMTDSVISHKPGLWGKPHVSPDSRTVVTLDRQRDGVTLVVQTVTTGGLKFVFDVKTTLNISAITFYPSLTTHGYDLYASATDKEDILYLNLMTGKVEMITGVGRAMNVALAQWGAPNRAIIASGVFGHFMVTPSNDALFVVNGETRTVNCEIGGLTHPRALVWVTMQLQ